MDNIKSEDPRLVGQDYEDGHFGHDTVKGSTNDDALDMLRLGKTQELRRNFKSISILGMAAVTMGTWSALLTTSSFSLINGGLAGTIWVYLASWLFSITVACSLAEMASMAPTSGGQYRKFPNAVVDFESCVG